jgi:hypothetical protein
LRKFKRAIMHILSTAAMLGLASCVEQEMVIGPDETGRKVMAPASQAGPSISEMLGAPGQYKGREVTVTGKVKAGMAFEFIEEQPYIINDGTGEIWIATTGAVPEDGSVYTVSGTFESPYQIKGRRYAAAVVVRGGAEAR